jgi:hypothetical protein
MEQTHREKNWDCQSVSHQSSDADASLETMPSKLSSLLPRKGVAFGCIKIRPKLQLQYLATKSNIWAAKSINLATIFSNLATKSSDLGKIHQLGTKIC